MATTKKHLEGEELDASDKKYFTLTSHVLNVHSQKRVMQPAILEGWMTNIS